MSDEVPRQGLWPATKQTFTEFSEDNGMTWAAAVAFYCGLSLAPMLTLLAWIVSSLFGPGATATVERALIELLGQKPGEQLGQMLQDQSEGGGPAITTAAGLVSLAILLFSATGVFAQLQTALNHMWDVKQKPSAGVMGFVRKRILSLGMLLAIVFLLIVSMVASALLTSMTGGGGQSGWWWELLNIAVSLIVFTLLFALMFKYLPDAHVRWSDVWIGGALTAVLFVIGKFALGLYLGRGSYESSYGAAVGSFVALLVWVYYSSVIFFVGAEATQVYALRRGHPVEPDKHAVKVIEQTRTTPSHA